MKTIYCNSCKRETGHGRKFGIGTLLAVLFTGGFWLLTLPFYSKRCTICGIDTTVVKDKKSSFYSDINSCNWYKKWQVWLIIAIIFFGFIGKSLEEESPKNTEQVVKVEESATNKKTNTKHLNLDYDLQRNLSKAKCVKSYSRDRSAFKLFLNTETYKRNEVTAVLLTIRSIYESDNANFPKNIEIHYGSGIKDVYPFSKIPSLSGH